MQRAVLNRATIEVADTTGVCGARIRFSRVADSSDRFSEYVHSQSHVAIFSASQTKMRHNGRLTNDEYDFSNVRGFVSDP